MIDYRTFPSHGGGAEASARAGTYDDPADGGQMSVAPMTDQTWKAYDSPDDAYRYGGINSPEAQAALHADPDPVMGSRGWSPDLERMLRWERAADGGSAR